MAKKQEWNMPLPSLYQRLGELTKGRILEADAGRPAARPENASAQQWEAFVAHTDVQPRWVDFVLKW
jgi:hypothetical protein